MHLFKSERRSDGRLQYNIEVRSESLCETCIRVLEEFVNDKADSDTASSSSSSTSTGSVNHQRFQQVATEVYGETDIPDIDVGTNTSNAGSGTKIVAHHKDAESLRASSEGCFICGQLQRVWGCCAPLFCTADHSFYPGVIFQEPAIDLKFKSANKESKSSIDEILVRLIHDPVDDSEHASSFRKFQKLAEASSQRTYTGDEAVIDLIRAWLASDAVRHCRSRNEAETTFMASTKPSRLLDLRDEKVRLTSIWKDTACPAYATLSYVWGQETFFMHTIETARELKAGVPLAKFPTTFRDAITLCRRLGFEYLWIDCYCIMQGTSSESRIDWENEAGNMGGIYGNSELTIAAAYANSPWAGLFKERDLRGKEPCVVHWKQLGGSWTRTSRAEVSCWDMSLAKPRRLDTEYMGNEPLFARGWVFQERLLCKRMLRFGTYQVMIEYTQYSSSETEPEHTATSQLDGQSLRTARTGIQSWGDYVTHYSKLGLSYPSDKLMALASIAKVHQIGTLPSDEEYVAGIHSFYLPKGLCWKPVPQQTSARKVTAWRAPSWSWASTDAVIEWPTCSFMTRGVVTSVVGWNIELQIPNEPYGPLKGATLHLRGTLLTTSACHESTGNETTLVLTGGIGSFVDSNKGARDYYPHGSAW